MKSSRTPGNRRSSDKGRRRKTFLKRMQRRLFAEQLETRVLLAGDVLHNFDDPYDTDNNGVFSPADILHVINQINASTASRSAASGEGSSGSGSAPVYYNDVNGDGYVSPIDSLHTINEFNDRAEGENELVLIRIDSVYVGTNTPINTVVGTPGFQAINKGDDYELRVRVQDLRMQGGPDGDPDGVYGTWFDLLYPKLITNVEIQEIQTVTFGNSPEGGTFTLTFDTDGAGGTPAQTTGNINYTFDPLNETLSAAIIAGNMQSALNTTFGANRIIVTPVDPNSASAFSIRYMGSLGDRDVTMMSGNASLLTNGGPPAPTITVAETVKGVYSAASFRSSFRFSPVYQSGKEALDGQVSPFADPNRMDEVGAFFTQTQGIVGPGLKEFMRVRMNTVNDGVIAMTGSVADIQAVHETLVFSGGHDTRDVVDPSEIQITNHTPFTVTEPFSAKPDSYSFAETAANTVRNLTVMTNSGGGLDTGNLTNVTISAISTTSLSIGNLAIAPGNTSINFTQLANINSAGTPATFTYTLRNSATGVTDTATVTLNVTAVNNAPVNTVPLVPAVQSTAEETPLAISGVSIADIDVNETPAAAMQVDLSVLHGTITLNSIPAGVTFIGGTSNGTPVLSLEGSLADLNTALTGITYTPALDYVGPDTFRIITSDRGNTGGGVRTDNDTVSINVTAVNDAPTVTLPALAGPVLEEETLIITGATVDDVDAGNGIEEVTLSVFGGNGGRLNLTSTTGITFVTPNNQSSIVFTGTLANLKAALASFTYTPQRGDAPSQDITLSINDKANTGAGELTASDSMTVEVTPLSLPFARRDPTPGNAGSLAAFTVSEGSTGNLLPVLANDLVHPLNNPILVSVDQPAQGTTAPGGGANTGKVVYTTAGDFWGTDTFTYVMFEDNPPAGDPVEVPSTGTVTVTITNVNDAPVAVDSLVTIDEDPVNPEIITLSVSDVDDNNNVNFVTTLTPTILSGPASGSATVIATGVNKGKISYVPNLNFSGSDSFTYTVNDGQGAGNSVSNTATVFITVNAVNDAPVAQAGTLTAAEETATTGTLVATDVDSAALTYSLVSTANARGTVLITNASTGAYTYTPELNYNGPASFTFQASDGSLDSNTATVNITVTAINDPPVANPESYLVENETLLNANVAAAGNPRSTVRANDSDVDNTLASLTVSLEAGMGPSNAASFTLNADGSFQYTAPGTFVGIDTFVYRLTDPSGDFSTATVTIDVREKNDPPIAVNDAYDITEDIQRDVDTAAGVRDGAGLDSDPDTLSPNSSLTVLLLTPPAHDAVFNLNADGSFRYQADANYNGPDSFTYQLRDGFGALSNIATVSLNVLEVNDDPTATADGSPSDRLTLIKNTTANPFEQQEIDVLANDSDAPDFNGENITIISAGGPGGVTLLGVVTISGDAKKLLYTPNIDAEGEDEFTYTISDGNGGTKTTTVFIEVVNFIPTDITGTVFADTNNNGVMDGNEKGLAGVKVVLEGHDTIFNIDFGADTDNNFANDVAALVVYTDINGNYRFDAPGSGRPGMRPGSYTITQEQPVFMRDGLDRAGNNAALIANDRMSMTLPLLGIPGGIHGNNFGERGLDPSVISISEILASGTGNGLILAIDASTQLWYMRLTGWTNLKSCSVVLSGDTSSATFTFTDMQDSVHVRTISQAGNPRFHLMGRNANGDELIRLDGSAADFDLDLQVAGNQGQQPEGESDDSGDAGYSRSVDAIMAEVGNA